MVATMQENYEYVISNKEKLFKDYANKYLLISDKKVYSSFDSYDHAANEGIRLFGIGEIFLVYYMAKTEPINIVCCAII